MTAEHYPNPEKNGKGPIDVEFEITKTKERITGRFDPEKKTLGSSESKDESRLYWSGEVGVYDEADNFLGKFQIDRQWWRYIFNGQVKLAEKEKGEN